MPISGILGPHQLSETHYEAVTDASKQEGPLVQIPHGPRELWIFHVDFLQVVQPVV